MTDLQQSFDPDVWRWEMTAGEAPGLAGSAALVLPDGVRLEVDGVDGRLLRIDVDAEDGRGAVSDGAVDILRSLGLDRPRDAATVPISADVVALVARLALLEAERGHAEAMGPMSSAWSIEAAALRHELALPGATLSPRAQLPTGDALDRARQAHQTIPAITGEVAVDGLVAVDPSWITPGVLDLRRTRTTALPGSTEVIVSTLVRDGIYPAAVSGVTAALIEKSSGIIIGIGTFEFDLLDRFPVAVSRILVGPRRSPDTVELWLTSDLRFLPSPRLRVARRATELGRRAVQAERLGLRDRADHLLEGSRQEWARIGRTHSPVQLVASAPFAGEIDDLGALTDLQLP